jgi:hypothetical protein
MAAESKSVDHDDNDVDYEDDDNKHNDHGNDEVLCRCGLWVC